jgi:putative ABC transport system permease protein
MPARRLGGAAGQLASDNATRNPARTAATAAALMVGLALVTFVAVLGQDIIAGVLAAIAPARRASRLNVLEALQYE